MTHKELVEIAYKWLVKNGDVGVAFKELKSIASEIPDVIGFDSWQSVLIECKVSRADFLSDKNKDCRVKGMGNWRFYCCPTGMIKVEELPPKWGLIYVNEKGKARLEYNCRKKKVPYEKLVTIFGVTHTHRLTEADENRFEADAVEERRIMYTALRRLFIRGFMQHIYEDKGDRPDADEIILLNNNSVDATTLTPKEKENK